MLTFALPKRQPFVQPSLRHRTGSQAEAMRQSGIVVKFRWNAQSTHSVQAALHGTPGWRCHRFRRRRQRWVDHFLCSRCGRCTAKPLHPAEGDRPRQKLPGRKSQATPPSAPLQNRPKGNSNRCLLPVLLRFQR